MVRFSASCWTRSFASYAPGLHHPRTGGHTVVWWDPNVLALHKEHGGGVRYRQILQADEPAARITADASARAHAAWQARRADALAKGSTPSVVVQTVTAAAHATVLANLGRGDTRSAPALAGLPRAPNLSTPLGASLLAVALETVPDKQPGRPRGKRFGTLVHAILATVDLRGDAEHVRAVGRNHARLVGAPPEECDAAIVAVRAALGHPLLVRAAAAEERGALHREVPVVVRAPTGLIEGVVDLTFAEPTAGAITWTVIDFKTDAELEHRRPIYEAQVRAYAQAISAATSSTANPVLLIV